MALRRRYSRQVEVKRKEKRGELGVV